MLRRLAVAASLVAASLGLARPGPAAAETPARGPGAAAMPSGAPGEPGGEGVVSAAGAGLAAFLDSMQVEKHWIAGHHVNWRTGDPDGRPVPPEGAHSHCSAFVAAACSRLGIPMLEPPEHPQVLLASAQCRWLEQAGRGFGWSALRDGLDAQRRANAGDLVVACARSSDPEEPGHIAIVRPAALGARHLATHGPQVIQAGVRNWNSTSARRGFEHHRWAWVHGRIHYFRHAVPAAPAGADR